MTIEGERLGRELRDKVFLTYILLEKLSADIWTIVTTFQRLSKIFWKSTAVDENPVLLPSYTQDFESMFVKEEFDILLEHYW